MQESDDSIATDGWLEFTKWTHSSFPKYLTIDEKIRIYMSSWVEGEKGWKILLGWRMFSFVTCLYFFLESATFGSFRYLTQWGFFISSLSFTLFMVQYAYDFFRRGNAEIRAI